VPSPADKLNGIGARLADLAEDGQPVDTIEHGEAANAAGAAKRPRRSNAELACRHAGLDALANRKLGADRIEHDCSAVDYAEHPAADFRAGSVEGDALDCRDCPVVYGAKCCD
jgi:hypothetical protein